VRKVNVVAELTSIGAQAGNQIELEAGHALACHWTCQMKLTSFATCYRLSLQFYGNIDLRRHCLQGSCQNPYYHGGRAVRSWRVQTAVYVGWQIVYDRSGQVSTMRLWWDEHGIGRPALFLESSRASNVTCSE